MLTLQEYHPHFLAFAQVHAAYLEGDCEDSVFDDHCRAFESFLLRLQGRLNWELPLVSGYVEAQDAIRLLEEPLKNLTLRIQHQPASEAVATSLQDCLRAMHRVQCFFAELPVFVDVAVVNELLVLGSASEALELEAIRHRLPFLLQWLGDLEASWNVFLTLYPHRESLVKKALFVIQAIKGGAGGIHLFLEGEEQIGLHESIQLVVAALEALSPLEETRYWDEFEKISLSQDLILDRGAKLLALLGTLPPSYQAVLRKWVAAKSQAMLDLQCLADPGSEERLAGLSQDLGLRAKEVQKFALDHSSILENLEQWRQQFEDVTKAGRS